MPGALLSRADPVMCAVRTGIIAGCGHSAPHARTRGLRLDSPLDGRLYTRGMRYAHHCTTCVDLLYFDGCPSYLRVWHDLAGVISEGGLDACVRLVLVDTLEAARRLGFAGSPTVKINGRDLEGFDGEAVMACRVYQENGGNGWPSRELLRRSLSGDATARAR